MSRIPEFQSGRKLETSIATNKWIEARMGFRRDNYMEFADDFHGDGIALSGATLTGVTYGGMTITKTSAASNDNRIGYQQVGTGHLYLLHGPTAEAQTERVDLGDSLSINLSLSPVVEIRAAINTHATQFQTNERAVFGVCSANATVFNNATFNMWFRVEGGANNIFYEYDLDAAGPDVDLVDTGVTFSSGVFRVLRIDFTSLANVLFSIDGRIIAKINMSALPLGTTVQPYVCSQKTTGTGADAVIVDYIQVTGIR